MLNKLKFKDSDEAIAQMAASMVGDLKKALNARPRASLVVSGGRTPQKILPMMIDTGLDWGRVSITLTDERWVPLTHPESNAGMVHRTLMDQLSDKPEFLGFWEDGLALQSAPDTYTKRCHEMFEGPFDVVFLGMGEDAHIASIFPNGPWQNLPTDCIAFVDDRPCHEFARISLSPARLFNARNVHLMVAGDGKKGKLAEADTGRVSAKYPVSWLYQNDQVKTNVYDC